MSKIISSRKRCWIQDYLFEKKLILTVFSIDQSILEEKPRTSMTYLILKEIVLQLHPKILIEQLCDTKNSIMHISKISCCIIRSWENFIKFIEKKLPVAWVDDIVDRFFFLSSKASKEMNKLKTFVYLQNSKTHVK